MATGIQDDRTKSHRGAVLDALRTADTPLGVTELAEQLTIHPNTVRFHLDALVTQGLVDRHLEQPTGRGRPRTLHTPHPGMDRGGQRQYQLLAKILLNQLSTTPNAPATTETAGHHWGTYLIDHIPPPHQPTTTEATQRLTTMMTNLGFAPEPDTQPNTQSNTKSNTKSGTEPGERIRLRHCPFLELAEEYSPTLCPLHLGLIRGALTQLRAPLTATTLEPFAEPDACILHLTPTTRPRRNKRT